MLRNCTACGCAFGSRDLAAVETAELESERYAAGLEGMLFRYYLCPECEMAVIFVDPVPLLGESDDAFRRRTEELEQTLGGLCGDEIEVVVTAARPRAAALERHFSALRPGRLTSSRTRARRPEDSAGCGRPRAGV